MTIWTWISLITVCVQIILVVLIRHSNKEINRALRQQRQAMYKLRKELEQYELREEREEQGEGDE